jgi:hypothetical protein
MMEVDETRTTGDGTRGPEPGSWINYALPPRQIQSHHPYRKDKYDKTIDPSVWRSAVGPDKKCGILLR